MDKVARTPIPNAAKRNFDAIRRHRNRIVHFSHDIDSQDRKVVETVAREQLRAWFDLHQLLTVQWKGEFRKFAKHFGAIEVKLSGHRDYLQAKYDGPKSEIKRKSSEGGDFRRSQACAFKALEADSIVGD